MTKPPLYRIRLVQRVYYEIEVNSMSEEMARKGVQELLDEGEDIEEFFDVTEVDNSAFELE